MDNILSEYRYFLRFLNKMRLVASRYLEKENFNCYYPIMMFFVEMYSYSERNQKERNKVYGNLAKKRNPVEHLYQAYLNDSQKSKHDSVARLLVNEAYMTMKGEWENNFLECPINEKIIFYFDCKDDGYGKKEWYYSFIDAETDESLHHRTGSQEINDDELINEIALVSYLSSHSWLNRI